MRAPEHRLLLGVVAVYVVALCVGGILLHPIAVPGGEYDFYADRAERLLAGELANDPFHGWLYPLLVAGVAALVGDGFAAGRVVASVAAGALVYALHRDTHRRFGARTATWTSGLLLANAPFALLAMQAASDMLAAALLLAACWRLPAASTRGGRALAGACVGLAVATRPGLLPLAAVFVAVAWLSPLPGVGAGGRRGVGSFGLGLVAGWLPHGLLTALQYGSAFTNENWRVLGAKAAGWDNAVLHQPAHAGLVDVLVQQGDVLWRLGVGDFAAIWSHHLGAWLGGRSPVAGVAAVLSGLALVGAVVHGVRHRRASWLGLGLVVGYSCLLAVAFSPDERALLPVAPLVLAWVVDLLRHLPRPVGAVAGAAWLIVVLLAVPGCLQAFRERHPTAEVRAAMQLRAEHGPTVTVVGTYPLLTRHAGVRGTCVTIPPSNRYSHAAMWQAIEATAGGGIDYFVTSRATFWQPLSEFVAAAPAGVEVVPSGADVLVLRLPRRRVAWLAGADVARAPDVPQLLLTVRTLPVDGLLGVGFTVRPPVGAEVVMPLSPVGPGEYRGTMAIPSGAAGTWRFVPGCMTVGGAIHEAPAIEVRLP